LGEGGKKKGERKKGGGGPFFFSPAGKASKIPDAEKQQKTGGDEETSSLLASREGWTGSYQKKAKIPFLFRKRKKKEYPSFPIGIRPEAKPRTDLSARKGKAKGAFFHDPRKEGGGNSQFGHSILQEGGKGKKYYYGRRKNRKGLQDRHFPSEGGDDYANVGQ